MTVHAFDFDGTLTKRDTFLLFLCWSAGRRKFVSALLRNAPVLVGMKLRIVPVQRAKEAMFAYFFRGMSLTDFDALCNRFVCENRHLFRSGAFDAVRGFADSSDNAVIIVSASLENYIVPFFKRLSVIVEATRVETDGEGRLTGRFLGKNCKGEEKVHRILSHFPDRAAYRLVSYGDSAGDREMFAFSDDAHFRPFS